MDPVAKPDASGLSVVGLKAVCRGMLKARFDLVLKFKGVGITTLHGCNYFVRTNGEAFIQGPSYLNNSENPKYRYFKPLQSDVNFNAAVTDLVKQAIEKDEQVKAAIAASPASNDVGAEISL